MALIIVKGDPIVGLCDHTMRERQPQNLNSIFLWSARATYQPPDSIITAANYSASEWTTVRMTTLSVAIRTFGIDASLAVKAQDSSMKYVKMRC